jgi:hypothetical protein
VNHIARIKRMLNGARGEDAQAVKDRIDTVVQMKHVVLTEGLLPFPRSIGVDPFPSRHIGIHRPILLRAHNKDCAA